MVIWTYLVVEQQNSGWSVTGDSGFSFGEAAGLTDVLTAVGEKGWELAGIAGAAPSGSVYIFKRPADIGEDASS
jgi:hypothetical protein